MNKKIISLILASFISISSASVALASTDSPEPSPAESVSDTYYETGTGTGSSGSEENPPEEIDPSAQRPDETIQSYVYRYLTEELFLCPAAAAGIMGNIMIECAFDQTIEAMDVNGLYSFGLMMWNGPRYEYLKSWCAENGLDYLSAEGQLKYLKMELFSTEHAAYKAMLEIPNTIEGAAYAAIQWAAKFERCWQLSYGLRIYYTLNIYWPEYANGSLSETQGIYGYYYNVPVNIKYGEALTLYGAVASYSSKLKTVTVGVYTEEGEMVTGKTLSRDDLVTNIGILDRFVIFNIVPKGEYYYVISAENESGEYIVGRHKFTVSDDKTTSKIIYESEGGVMCPLGINCPSLGYKDIPPAKNWAHKHIDFVINEGIFEGNPDLTFKPNDSMTRAMFMAVLCRLGERYSLFDAGLSIPSATDDLSGFGYEETPDEAYAEEPTGSDSAPEDTSSDGPSASDGMSTEGASVVDSTGSESSTSTNDPEEDFEFSDVPVNSWYAEYVYRAVDTGLAEGMGGGKFEPHSTLTRAQLAVLMYRLAGACGVDTDHPGDLTVFPDSAEVKDWSVDAMSWAVGAGLITGSKENGNIYLYPQGDATRAQVCAIIERFITLMDNASTAADA